MIDITKKFTRDELELMKTDELVNLIITLQWRQSLMTNNIKYHNSGINDNKQHNMED